MFMKYAELLSERNRIAECARHEHDKTALRTVIGSSWDME
jgi:hypothetical protein